MALVALVFVGASTRAQLKAGDVFPALATSSLEGALPDLQGRAVLVDFWASWCAPCKVSFPVYARLHSDYAARGLAIVAVSVDQNREAYAAFLEKLRPPFATVRDKDHQLARIVDVPAMPTCFLIGADGRVRFIHTGFHGGDSEAALRREIEAVLAEKTSS